MEEAILAGANNSRRQEEGGKSLIPAALVEPTVCRGKLLSVTV
jgi:hypothetical protein